MNSVALIASNRVFVRGKYFNCSNFICKERSQWRLESRRSPFFSVFFPFLSALFVVVVVFFINHNYIPLACFPLFSLLTLYTSRDFYIYRLFRNPPVKFRFFLVTPLNVSLVGLFLFPLSVLAGFIWERGNKVESNGPGLHLDVTNP